MKELTHSFCGMFNTRYQVEGISHSLVPTCKVVLRRDRQHPGLCVSQACGRSTTAGENNPLFQGWEGSTLEVGEFDSPWHTITPHIDPHSMIPARCLCLAFPRLCLGFTSAAWIVLFKTRASRKNWCFIIMFIHVLYLWIISPFSGMPKNHTWLQSPLRFYRFRMVSLYHLEATYSNPPKKDDPKKSGWRWVSGTLW